MAGDDALRAWAADMSTVYDEVLVPVVFTPFADILAARVARHAPRRVLEIAAGTGVLTNAMLTEMPDATITATDLNQAMVDVGARRAPGATWQQADAMELPYAGASFDAVAVAFGVMFFPDKATAFAGIRRVLESDGVFLATVWGAIEAHDYERCVQSSLDEIFPDDPPRFLANVPHGYHDEATITADLRGGGLELVSYDEVSATTHAPSAAELARGYCFGTPVRAQIEARGDLAATQAALADALEARLGKAEITGRMVVHVIEARPAK